MTLNGQMQIVSVRMEEAGEYKCLARNILGEDEKTAILVVQSRFKYYVLFDLVGGLNGKISGSSNVHGPTHVRFYHGFLWDCVRGAVGGI